MNIRGIIALAFTSIVEHPLRSLLTSLGIIIGVATVYAMLALGDMTQKKVEESLDSIGARTINVFRDWGGRRSSQSRPILPFTEQDVIDMRTIPGVYAATGAVTGRNPTIATDTSDISGNFLGIDTDYVDAVGSVITLGENISFVDVDQSAPVALVSEGIQQRMFNNQNPLGQMIKVNNVALTIKGVVSPAEDTGISFGNDDVFVWAPITIARARIEGGNRFVTRYVENIKVVGNKGADFGLIEDEMNIILRRTRGLKAGDRPDYRVFTQRGWQERAAEETKGIGIMLAAMGAISLLVGGVGVMNIMLVSVTERTREIGLRMALGAQKRDIMMQFIAEALMLCLLSGIVGLVLGFGMSKFFIELTKEEMVFNPSVALLAFAASFVTGLIFGFLPARRAANLNPIEALRHE